MKKTQHGRHLASHSTAKRSSRQHSHEVHAVRHENRGESRTYSPHSPNQESEGYDCLSRQHSEPYHFADGPSHWSEPKTASLRIEGTFGRHSIVSDADVQDTADFSINKRGLFIAGYICLLLAFLIGSIEVFSFKEARVSESENRMLQGFPRLSLSRVVSGEYMNEMESYLSDAFLFRDEAAAFSEKQLALFAIPDNGPDNWDVDADHLDAPAVSENADMDETAGDETSVQISESEEAEPVEIPSIFEVMPSEVSSSDFYLLDEAGEKTVLYSFSADQMASFATMLNMYRAALPEDGTLHYCVPPVSQQANNILQKHKYVGWGSELDDVLQDVVNDGIFVYDVTDILTPYLETSRLYPVSDHHWLPLSASLVCEEMLQNQGVPPMDYYEYTFNISSIPIRSSFYGDELKALSLGSDDIEILQPVSPVQSYMLRHLTERRNGVFIDNTEMGLKSYLGGLNGPWRLFETGFHTGRNAIIVTDSFGLTFAPFLAPYYDTILFVDLRESLFNLDISGGTIKDYIDYYDIDDMYMLSSAIDEDIVEGTQSRLFKYLG